MSSASSRPYEPPLCVVGNPGRGTDLLGAQASSVTATGQVLQSSPLRGVRSNSGVRASDLGELFYLRQHSTSRQRWLDGWIDG